MKGAREIPARRLLAPDENVESAAERFRRAGEGFFTPAPTPGPKITSR
jgi:hypothetical protein